MEGLVEQTGALDIGGKDSKKGSQSASKAQQTPASGGDGEWEVLSASSEEQPEEVAIRVDQYLVVFLKFMASVTPGIEHDFTMGV